MKKSVLFIPIIIIAMLLFVSCAKDVSVRILDSGKETTAQTKTGLKVSEVLKKNHITVGDKDEVEPSLKSEITDKTTTITIKRYAKVTVIKNEEEQTVELLGGTVQDAIEEAGFELTDDEKIDKDPDAYLKNGMKINIQSPKTITLTADGDTSTLTTSASTVKGFLAEHNITLGVNDEVRPGLNTKITEDMVIVVDRVEYKEEVYTETIKYSTEVQTDNSMKLGESKVTQKGKNGKKEITYKIKIVNGKEVSKEKTGENVIKEPVNKIVVKGTKKSQKISAADAKKIAENYWKSSGSGNVVVVNDTPVKKNGKKYYQCFLKWQVDGHLSTIDTIYVNAKTGECTTSI